MVMTSSLQWKPQYSVHNAEIDKEHQQLFLIVNDLLSIDNPRQQLPQFKADVKSLFRYMQTHFAHEEDVMERIGYPHREAHAALHQEIVATMNALLKNCATLAELREKLRSFLVQWLRTHVIEEDGKLTEHIDRYAMAGRMQAVS
jgi:hemerythrin